MTPTRLLLSVPLAALLAVPAASQIFTIDQPVGGDTFGARSTGQTFTPSVGVSPSPGTPASLQLVQFTMYRGNATPAAPSATTYLNIYDGDPNGGGSFIGSSTTTVDTTGLSFHDPMVWTFGSLALNFTTEHWAIMSSTNLAGSLDVEVPLETEPRNGPPGPNIYTGGSGLIANIAPHPNSVDAKFEIVFGTPLCFVIDQSVGGDNFGGRSTGQTFTPGVGISPSPGANPVLPLTELTIYQGNSGAVTPSATTYLNIYDGDPNGAGVFVGSSTNFVDTNGPVFHAPMRWTFNLLALSTTTEYWAIMSSTSTAGNLDVECSLETEPRNGPPGPNIYTGGAGLIAAIVPHPNSVDTRFEAVFSFGLPASFTTFGVGCAGSGGMATVSSSGLPRLGQPFTVDCTNLPPAATSAFAALGFVRFNPGLDLTVIDATGCTLYMTTDFVSSESVTGGNASWTIPMPSNAFWLGRSLFFQWFAIDIGANPFGLISSNAGEAIIGC